MNKVNMHVSIARKNKQIKEEIKNMSKVLADFEWISINIESKEAPHISRFQNSWFWKLSEFFKKWNLEVYWLCEAEYYKTLTLKRQ